MYSLIFGRRRMGKSTLSLNIAHSSQVIMNGSNRTTIIIFDPNAQFQGFPTTSNPSDIGVFMEATVGARLPMIAVFRPTPGTVSDDFKALVDVLWTWDEYGLIIDEASMLQGSGWTDPTLELLTRQCPSGVSIVQSTHRPVDTSRLVRSLSTDLFFFRTTNQSDIKLVENEYGKLVADAIQDLGTHQCLHYWIASGGVEKVSLWENPGDWALELDNNNTIKAEL